MNCSCRSMVVQKTLGVSGQSAKRWTCVLCVFGSSPGTWPVALTKQLHQIWQLGVSNAIGGYWPMLTNWGQSSNHTSCGSEAAWLSWTTMWCLLLQLLQPQSQWQMPPQKQQDLRMNSWRLMIQYNWLQMTVRSMKLSCWCFLPVMMTTAMAEWKSRSSADWSLQSTKLSLQFLLWRCSMQQISTRMAQWTWRSSCPGCCYQTILVRLRIAS